MNLWYLQLLRDTSQYRLSRPSRTFYIRWHWRTSYSHLESRRDLGEGNANVTSEWDEMSVVSFLERKQWKKNKNKKLTE